MDRPRLSTMNVRLPFDYCRNLRLDQILSFIEARNRQALFALLSRETDSRETKTSDPIFLPAAHPGAFKIGLPAYTSDLAGRGLLSHIGRVGHVHLAAGH